MQRALGWSQPLLLAGVILGSGQIGVRCGAASAAELSRRDVCGLVVDGTGPVAGASVRPAGTGIGSRTDAQGRFRFAAASSSVRLVACKPGYYLAGAWWKGGQEPLEIVLHRHADQDAAGYAWISSYPGPEQPEQCGNCHGEIFREWSSGGHARSASNPHFRNLYDGTDWHGNENTGWSLLAQRPEASGVCFSCHVPSLPPDLRVVGDLRTVGGTAREGVHCDYCHKIAEVSVDRVGLNHGRFATRLLRPGPGKQIFFGPLEDADRASAVYSPLYRRSEFCAVCHEGILLGTHVYGEYSEWLASPAFRQGVQCQDCHMRPTGRMHNMAPGRGGVERDPATLASHGSARGDSAVLRRHAVMEVRAQRATDSIEVAVEISARGVGHRLPTGYPDRALIVWVAAKDRSGRDLALAEGPRLPLLAGPGKATEGCLADQPGKMYAKILQGLDGAVPVPFWVPNRLASDSRLHPDQTDRLRFRFHPPEGNAEIVVRLIYRAFSKHQADRKGWPDNEILVDTKTIRL